MILTKISALRADDRRNSADDTRKAADYNTWIWAKIKKKIGGGENREKPWRGSYGNILFFLALSMDSYSHMYHFGSIFTVNIVLYPL